MEKEIITHDIRELGMGFVMIFVPSMMFFVFLIYVYDWHMQRNKARNADNFVSEKNNKFVELLWQFISWRHALIFGVASIPVLACFYTFWLIFYTSDTPTRPDGNTDFIISNILFCLLEVWAIANTIIAIIYYRKCKSKLTQMKLTIKEFKWIHALLELREKNSLFSRTKNFYLNQLFNRVYCLTAGKPLLTGKQLISFLNLNRQIIDIFTMFLKSKQNKMITKFKFYPTGLWDTLFRYASFNKKTYFINANREKLSTEIVTNTLFNYFNAFSII